MSREELRDGTKAGQEAGADRERGKSYAGAGRIGTEGQSGTARTLLPGSTVGVLGGGQLGRMMALAGGAMGYRFVALEPAEDSPFGQVAPQITAAYSDLEAARELARRSDVITYEFENVDAGVAALLGEEAYVPQGSRLLYTTQHRLREKAAIEAAGVPVAPYRPVSGLDGLKAAAAELGLPCVLKTATGGYDGKGQAVIRREEELEAALEAVAPGLAATGKNGAQDGAAEGQRERDQAEIGGGPELVLEKFISFSCEISVVAARSASGEVRSFPPSENVHVNNILHLSVVPARVSAELQKRACELAERLIEGLDAVGLLAVEMFVTEDGALYVNELAPRPHNSGHYTMDACAVSQFEQHVRAVCNLPLAEPRLLTPAVMVNVLGQHLEEATERLCGKDEAAQRLGVIPKLHLYGKSESKTGRKMGHINLLCKDTADALAWVEHTKIWRN